MPKRSLVFIPVVIIILSILACSLGQTATTLQATLEPTLAPSNTPESTPTGTLSPVLPTTQGPVSRMYSVALLTPGHTANIRSAPGQDTPIIGSLTYDSGLISGTGNTAEADGLHWIEIAYAQNTDAWVSSLYLTEYVPSGTFCSDERVTNVLENLRGAVITKDGELFKSAVSPTRGLSVRLLTNGNWANYTPEQVSWLFKSSYVYDWGLGAGSGLPVTGSFMDEVYPFLLRALDTESRYACNQVLVGGTTYTATWPDYYRNFNYYSAYMPLPDDSELGWHTFLIGFEYVNGQPYVINLVHYAWEP
jgi:hypothetical protein